MTGRIKTAPLQRGNFEPRSALPGNLLKSMILTIANGYTNRSGLAQFPPLKGDQGGCSSGSGEIQTRAEYPGESRWPHQSAYLKPSVPLVVTNYQVGLSVNAQ
jgi:hypothetical protein